MKAKGTKKNIWRPWMKRKRAPPPATSFYNPNGNKKCWCARCVRKMVVKGQLGITNGGLRISDLTKDRNGRIISKQRMLAGKRNYSKSALFFWNKAMIVARNELETNGWVGLKKKTLLYHTTRRIYEELLTEASHHKIRSKFCLDF